MDWKNIAIGAGNAVGQVVPQMERMDLAEQGMGMRKDIHNVAMKKYEQEEKLRQGLEGIAMKYVNQGRALTGGQAPEQSVQPAPAQQPTGAGNPESHFTAIATSGEPNIDSGSAIELKSQNVSSIPGQPAIGGQGAASAPAQQDNGLAVRNLRGNMLMEMHDFLMGNGRIAEARQLRKAEVDNIIHIAKISPRAALQSWNKTPWLVEEYGQLTPEDIQQKGEYTFMKFGDKLIRTNKNGQVDVVPGVKDETEKQPTPQMYVEKAVGQNLQQKFQYNPQTRQHDIPFGEPYRIHKPDKEGGGGEADKKEFRKEIAGLDGLYKSKASIQKGVDPLTGQIIPQDNVRDALATIEGQIQSKEQWISSEYPDQWKTYRQPKDQPKGAIGGGKRTMGDLYKIITDAGSSSKAVVALGKLGYSEAQAKKIIKDGITEGYIK